MVTSQDNTPHLLTLFEAIEAENDGVVENILIRIIVAARKDGWDAATMIEFLESKDMQLGDSLRQWIIDEFAALEKAEEEYRG